MQINFSEWISRTFSEIVSAPGVIRQWAELSTKNLVIALLGAAAAASMLIAVTIYYIRCIVRKKRETPFALFAVLVIIGFGLWKAQDYIVRYQLPEAEIIQTEKGEFLVYDQYSLAPGSTTADAPSLMDASIQIVDNTFTWKIEDGLIFQLTDIQTLCSEHPYTLRSLTHEGQHTLIFRTDYTTSVGEDRQTVMPNLYLYILTDRKLEDEAWYLDSGASITTDRDFGLEACIDLDGSISYSAPKRDFHILENRGDSILFTVTWFQSGELALCDARQLGPDLVIAVSQTSANRWNNNTGKQWRHEYDPLSDEAERELLNEPLEKLFDGRLRLVRDVSAEDIKKILPCRIVHYPVPFCSEVQFFLPCSELLKMDDTYESEEFQAGAMILQFIGQGPDGQEHLYTLLDLGCMMYSSILSDAEIDALHEEFISVYSEGKGSPDNELSDYIGIPAVPYRDGWLLYIGKCFGDQQYYYYLTEDNIPA